MAKAKQGIYIKDINSLEIIPQRPMPISELSKRHPLEELALRGGGDLLSYKGQRKVRVGFKPDTEGFIELTVGNQTAVVHKDELIFVARFAKGSAAV